MFRGQDYSRFVARIAERCLDRPGRTLAVALVVLLVAVASASRIRIDPRPEAYLEGSAAWAFYRQIDERYEIGESVVVALRERGGTVFDVETVTAVAELDRVLTALPRVERVLSLASATTLERRGDVIDLGAILQPDPVTQKSALALGKRIAEHAVYSQILVDERHETTFLFVQLSTDDDAPRAAFETVASIRDEVTRFRSKHRTVHLAGSAVTKEAIATGIQRDTVLFFPAALALLTILLWFMFSDIVSSLVPLLVVGYATVVVVGVFAAFGVFVNMATAAVPTMILVIGLADGVHFLSELRRQFARSRDRRTALLATVEAVALPCLLTSLTSAVGFFALVSSRIVPLRELGSATALGLVLAYVTSMWLTPVALHLLQRPAKPLAAFPSATLLGARLGAFAAVARRRILLTLAVTGMLCGASVAAVSGLKVDSDFVGYLDDDHRLRRDVALIEETLGGADIIEVILDADEPGLFRTPAGLALLDTIGKDLENFEGVSRVFSLPDYLRLANAVMNDLPADELAPLPKSTEAIAQLELLDPIAFATLANDDQSQARITMQIPSMSTEQVLRLVELLRQAVAIDLAGTSVRATFTGLPPLFAQIMADLVSDAIGGFELAAILIFVAMLVGFRSASFAAVAMVPNVLTVGLTFGAMAVLGLSFDTNSAFIACLGIGIAVDDTIHIVARHQRARKEGAPTAQAAVTYALTHAGHPVVLTSLLLAVGFSVLCLSSFEPTFRLGLLCTLLVGFALLLDLLLLPVLLLLADRGP